MPTTHKASGFWRKHADKIGAAGSLVAALCCLGAPAVLSIVSAIGLSFIIKDTILVPALVAFLAIALYGLWSGFRRHGRRASLVIGLASAVGLLAFLWISTFVAAVALVGLIAATALNVWFEWAEHRRAKP